MHKSECSKGDLNESGNRVKEKENRDDAKIMITDLIKRIKKQKKLITQNTTNST